MAAVRPLIPPNAWMTSTWDTMDDRIDY
jgi:hypothetical protein